MRSHRLSVAAAADIEAIARHSAEHWGLARAEAYLLALHEAMERLALFPLAGRDVSELRAGYRRFEHEGHAIFFRVETDCVFVVRVLHARMEPRRHV